MRQCTEYIATYMKTLTPFFIQTLKRSSSRYNIWGTRPCSIWVTLKHQTISWTSKDSVQDPMRQCTTYEPKFSRLAIYTTIRIKYINQTLILITFYLSYNSYIQILAKKGEIFTVWLVYQESKFPVSSQNKFKNYTVISAYFK